MESLFKKNHSRHILELGAGWGEFLVKWMKDNPEDEYVAFEVKGDRIKRILKNASAMQHRLRIIPVNFNWFLFDILPENAFDWIIINFPDPWPKKRHWKHRLIDEQFPYRAASLLRKNGVIHIATDYGPYARKILRNFRRCELYQSTMENPDYRRANPGFPVTKFEMITAERIPYFQQWRITCKT